MKERAEQRYVHPDEVAEYFRMSVNYIYYLTRKKII